MIALVLIAVGGAAGALLRFFCVHVVSNWTGNSWAIFVVNFAGCFAIGLLVGFLGHTQWFSEYGRPLLVIGILGGFTTYSTFSMDFLNFLQAGRFVMAGTYVLVTTFGCLLAAYAGYRIGIS